MIAAAALFAVIGTCRSIALQPSNARVEWRTPMKVRDVRVAGDVAIVQNLWGVSAADARSGRILWSFHLRKDSRPLAEYAVLPDRVAVADFDDIVFIGMHSGEELHRTRMPAFVSTLTGPPLVAVTDNGKRLGSTLFALDSDGSIAARRIVRHVHELTKSGDVVIAQLDRNPGEDWRSMYKLAAFDATTLQPLWQIDGTLSTQIQEIGGRPHVIETPWGDNPRPIDIRTGRLGTPIPKREPTSEIWGAATWELETVTSTKDCERVRRNDPANGRPKWSIDLPFGIVATLREGETFYMFGTRGPEHHFLIAVDWSSGRLLGAWSGVPDIHTLARFGDRIIAGSFDELMSIRLD